MELADTLLTEKQAAAFIVAFLLSSTAAALSASARHMPFSLLLSFTASLFIWIFLFIILGATPFLAPLIVVNGFLIVSLARARSVVEAEPRAKTDVMAEHRRREEEQPPQIHLSHDDIETLAKERTLFMLRQSKRLRQALKQQETLNDLQRSFITMLSHEFRTPLAIMDGSAQKLIARADSLPADDIRQRAEAIRNAIQRLTALMEKILNSARYEDGNLPLTFRRCSLEDILRGCIATIDELSADHMIEAHLEPLPEVLGDKEALNQLFDNLLSNAVKYSPGAERVDVRATANDGVIAIEVEDYGLGIDDDDQPKLFNRFFRARNAEGIEGTGVGLSLVRQIVDRHGGTVSVHSRKGEGTKVTISLPAADVATVPETSSAVA